MTRKPAPPRGRRPRVKASKFRNRKYGVESKTLVGRFRGLTGLPLPAKLKTQLTYFQEGVSTQGSTPLLSAYQYALNSTYDPYVTGGGHEPMGYKQLMAFYQFCRVDKCRVVVEFTPGTGTGNPPSVGFQISENSSYSPTNLSEIVERGNCVYATLPNVAGYAGKVVLKKSWDASKWYPTYQKYDEQFANTLNAGPTGELVYGNVFFIGPNGATYTDGYYKIKLVMDVEFYGQVQLNQS